jgi:hypothetical protein
MSGWFVDLGAQGWSGADDVEVFLGTIEGGGKPLGHAQLGQNRPDVATALKDPFWAAAGWSASVTLPALTPGPTTVSVYVHTPDRGWWLRQIALTVGPQPTPSVPARSTPAPSPSPSPAPPIPSATPTSPFGNDISWPQCSPAAEPSGPAFAIIGINAGKPFTTNPCLPREYFWALSATSTNQPRVGVYMNTANPGPESPNWPSSSTTAPRTCDGTATADCAYDYGWLAAQYAFARAVGVLGTPAATQVSWWLDVEQANSWSATDLAANAASVHANIDFLRSVGVSSVGVYSTSTDWEALIGPPQANADPFGTLPNWRPGASGPQDAPAWCNRTVSGGKVKYVQFQSSGFDTNLACY